jgi:hypothetical protein
MALRVCTRRWKAKPRDEPQHRSAAHLWEPRHTSDTVGAPAVVASAPPQVGADATHDRHNHSGAVCAGSNPAGGTLDQVPKDPVTSGNAEAGVLAYVQTYSKASQVS